MQNVKFNQKEGLHQREKEKHIVFDQFDEFKIDPEEVVFKDISKLILHDGLIYILDSKQSRIFVFDSSAALISTIGQPGQGPGDLEYPRDFFIDSVGTVYVVNSAAQRIEVFSPDGIFTKRIDLSVPKDIFYSHPSAFLLNQDDRIFIAYNISTHLIDEYQDTGSFVRTLIKRDNPVKIPGVNIGNSSFMCLSKQNKDIIHFNYFTGVFHILSQSGIIKVKFSAYDSLHQNQMSKIIADIKKSDKPFLSIQVFELWSPFFCVNNQDMILSMLRLKNKKEPQKFFIFSKDGIYLYQMAIPFFKNDVVDQIYFYDNNYIFITANQKIFFSK
ncbi:MAG: 6-bladed beta-propeller [Candidatus Aminicenantes bacterium]|jgi:hypothetical protein